MLTVTATNGLNFAKNLSIAPVMKNLISAAVGKFCISIESKVRMRMKSIMISKSRISKSRISKFI
jgi:hypothetical protein